MKRLVLFAAIALSVSACTVAPERAPLRPIPEDGPPPTYATLLTRARAQATAATEAFYDNRWNDLEEVAQALEQTAKFLPKASDSPPAAKASIAQISDDLTKEAMNLRTAARAKDEKAVTATMSRVNLKVRELRLDQ